MNSLHEPSVLSPTRRAVLVLPEPPFPPMAGNALRDAQQIELLRRLGHEVHLLCVRPRLDSTAAADRDAAAARGVTLHLMAEHPRPSTEPMLARLARKAGYLVATPSLHPFAWWMAPYDLPRSLPAALAALQPDVVLMRSTFLGLLPDVRAQVDVPVVVDCHDDEVHLARELIPSVRWWRRPGPVANHRGVRRLWRARLPLAAEIWAVSVEDAARISAVAGPCPVLVVPSGVDERLVVPGPRPGPDDACALVANYGYGPNLDGVRWLLRLVWPRVRRARPAATLHLVGGGAEDALHQLTATTAGVTVLGRVADLAPIYHGTGVMLAPLMHGGGSRLKVVEAWQQGKALVATPKGIEGLGAPAGAAVCAPTPEAYADALASLLGDSARRARLGDEGRRFVLDHLAFDRLASGLRDRSVVAGSPRATVPHRAGR